MFGRHLRRRGYSKCHCSLPRTKIPLRTNSSSSGRLTLQQEGIQVSCAQRVLTLGGRVVVEDRGKTSVHGRKPESKSRSRQKLRDKESRSSARYRWLLVTQPPSWPRNSLPMLALAKWPVLGWNATNVPSYPKRQRLFLWIMDEIHSTATK